MRPAFSWVGRILSSREAPMQSRTLIALESFSYFGGSKNLKPGDRFEAASDSDVDALTLTNRARRATPADEAQGESDAAKNRGTYKTRDMKAERKAAA